MRLLQLGAPRVDAQVLRLLQPRALFVLLPALVSAGSATMALLKQQAQQKPGGQQGKRAEDQAAAAAQQQRQQQLSQLVQVHGQLIASIRAITAALLSSPQGLQLVATNSADLAALVLALDPTSAPGPGQAFSYATLASDPAAAFKGEVGRIAKALLDASAATAAQGGAGPKTPGTLGPDGQKRIIPSMSSSPNSPAAELACVLRAALTAQAAAAALEGAAPGSAESAAAVHTLVAAATGAAGGEGARLATLRVLAASPAAIAYLLRLMRERGKVHRAAAGMGGGGGVTGGRAATGGGFGALDDLDLDGDDVMMVGGGYMMGGYGAGFGRGPRYAPEALYASAVVLEVG